MDPSTLLEHRDFVKAVARALLGNDADVEDVVQETYVAALQAEPPRTGRVRPWLGGIARNVAKRLHRTRARRLRREIAAAKPDRVAEQSTEKLRWQQRVVEEVLALDPKYRDVLLLRYYEELPPREIAARLDLPVNTVRTRTRRAVEKLRARFDERYGRRAWTAALAGFFVTEVAAGSGKLIAAALVALVAGTAWLGHVALRGDAASNPQRTSMRADAAEAARAADAVETAASPDSRGDNPAPIPTRFFGQLFEFQTTPPQPLVDATLHLALAAKARWEPVATVRTDSEGRYEIPWKPDWQATPDRFGRLPSFLLFVERSGYWSGAMYVDARGFTEGYDLAVQLLANPRFRFVAGSERRPVGGVRAALLGWAGEQRPLEIRTLGSGVSDDRGCVEPEWPTHRPGAFLRVELPGGDVAQWWLSQKWARALGPVEIAVDPEGFASISVAVIGADGKAAGAGTSVYVDGVWEPGEGAAPVSQPLLGVTDASGTAHFRFPAACVREGVFVPHAMLACDDSPRYVQWYPPRGRGRDAATPSGLSLPTIRFEPAPPEARRFFVEGIDHDETVVVHGMDEEGHRRSWECRALVRLRHWTLHCFDWKQFGPAPDDRVASVVARRGGAFFWRRLTGAELARCVARESGIRLDRRAGVREISVHVDSAANVTVACDALPFETGGWVSPDRPRRFAVPDIPGDWRVSYDGKTVAIERPHRSEIHLE